MLPLPNCNSSHGSAGLTEAGVYWFGVNVGGPEFVSSYILTELGFKRPAFSHSVSDCHSVSPKAGVFSSTGLTK